MNNSPRQRGRPRGGSTARADILTAARRQFVDRGYRGATLRSIAAEAGVDVALINYHFGSKKDLHGAALGLSLSPAQVLTRALQGPIQSLPDRLLSLLLEVWDDPEHRPGLTALLEASIESPEHGRLFREMAERELVGSLADHLGGRDARARAMATGSQLAGLILLRYVLRVEPVASMTPQAVLTAFAPGMRAAMFPPRPARVTARS